MITTRTRALLWSAALLWALVALSGFHIGINHYWLGLILFMSGIVGAAFMLPITGVHGDFNVVGGIVYVLVNAVVFYWVLRLGRYLFQRFHRDSSRNEH